jgi:hypothetical protein
VDHVSVMKVIIQHQPALIDGLLAQTGLSLEREPP